MFKSALRSFNDQVMFPRRYKFLSGELSPYLAGCGSILDVGASNGRLMKSLTEKLGPVEVAGVDIKVQPNSVIPIKEYDGKTLPYADSSFDCVMFIDVLHHADDPDALLREAKRVSRKHVLVKDHYWNNWLDWQVLKWCDYFGNNPFDIVLPYNYLTVPTWHASFKQAGLEILSEKLFTKITFDPCKHVVYHLKK